MPKTNWFSQLPSIKKGESSALIWLWLSLFIVVLDQITKIGISASLELYQSIPIMPSFNLTLLHNKGAAWSILATAGGWQRWFLGGVAIIVIAIITAWLNRIKRQEYWLASALALVIGGAVGNVIDRIIYGYVVDFIDIYYQTWHWPAFNIADSAITVGIFIFLFHLLFKKMPL